MEMFSLTIVVFPFCSGIHNFAVHNGEDPCSSALVDRWPLKRLVTWYCKWDNRTMPWWYAIVSVRWLSCQISMSIWCSPLLSITLSCTCSISLPLVVLCFALCFRFYVGRLYVMVVVELAWGLVVVLLLLCCMGDLWTQLLERWLFGVGDKAKHMNSAVWFLAYLVLPRFRIFIV
jgi:hypothetical protein